MNSKRLTAERDEDQPDQHTLHHQLAEETAAAAVLKPAERQCEDEREG